MATGTIVTLILTIALCLCLLIGFLIGFKRGLVKSSIRFGVFVGLLIVAGLISSPIANALTKINLSGLNLVINGTIVETIPEAIKSLIFSNSLMEGIATSSPSTVKLVESLPGAILSLVVFFLLVLIMTLLSFFVYLIIAKTCLKESKLKKQLKKKKKQAKFIQDTFEEENEIKKLKNNRKRWFGGAVGVVGGFVFIFALLLPITSLTSTVSKITSQTQSVVYAETENESEFLSETSGDLIKYFLGEDVVDAINGYGNSVAGKILTVGGLDNLIFDAITNVKVENNNFKFRQEMVSASKIYDQCVYLVEEIGNAEDYTSVDFDKVNKILDTLFETNTIKILAPELIPYAVNYFYSTETFETLNFKTEIQYVVNGFVSDIKNNPNGFVKTLRNELNPILNVVKVACETGYVDDLMGGERDLSNLMVALKRNENKLLNSITSNIFRSEILKNTVPRVINAVLNIIEKGTNNELSFVELSTENVNWTIFEKDINSLIKNFADIYLILDSTNAVENIKLITNKNFEDNSFKGLMYLVGNEIQLLKENNLFKTQTENPFTTFVNYICEKDEFKDILNAEKLKNANWNVEFYFIVPSLVSLKNSGVLEHVLSNEEINENLVCDLLIELENERTYLENSISGFYDSSVFKKPISYLINELNNIIESVLSTEENSVVFEQINENNLTMLEKASIISVFENMLKAYELLSENELNLENLTNEEISIIGSFLNSLKENAFKYENGVPNLECVVSQDKTTVENGGIFAKVYVSMVNHAKKTYSFEGNVSIGTIEWISFLKTAKKLSEIKADEFLEILAGKEEDINVGEVLEVLGATEETIESIEKVTDSITNLDPESSKSFDDLANSLENLNDEKVDEIIDSVEKSTGEEIDIDKSLIEKEKIISSRISTLMVKTLTNENLQQSLNELCNGATVVLSQAVSKGVVINVTTSGGLEALENLIEEKTNNLTIQNLIKKLFGII